MLSVIRPDTLAMSHHPLLVQRACGTSVWNAKRHVQSCKSHRKSGEARNARHVSSMQGSYPRGNRTKQIRCRPLKRSRSLLTKRQPNRTCEVVGRFEEVPV